MNVSENGGAPASSLFIFFFHEKLAPRFRKQTCTTIFTYGVSIIYIYIYIYTYIHIQLCFTNYSLFHSCLLWQYPGLSTILNVPIINPNPHNLGKL